VAWTKYPAEPRLTWNGQTSFPVELTLWSFPDGIRLCRRPIDEIKNLRVSQQSWRDIAVAAGEKLIPEIQGDLLDIRAEIESAGARSFGLVVHGQRIQYSVADGMLRMGNVSAPLKLRDNRLSLRILVDRSSIDVFADRGQVTISTVTVDSRTDKNVSLLAEDGKIRCVSLEANRLESIWPPQRAGGGPPTTSTANPVNTKRP
jgi:fructan beta-fructosidase